MTNDERDAFRGTLEGLGMLRWDWPGLGVADRKRAAGADWFGLTLAIRRAEHETAARAVDRDVADLARTPSGIAPAQLINGYDLIEAGHTPGPVFARCLEQVYDAQLEDRIATRSEAMALAESIMAGGSADGARP
jgi:poly(A) polymerase